MHPLLPWLFVVLLAAGPCAADGPEGSQETRLVLEVMSFNLRWGPDPEPNGWDSRRERVVALLREEAPDVVGFQESRPGYVDDLLGRLPGYAAYPMEGERQNSILYRVDRLRLDRATSDEENARVDAPEHDWGPGSVRLPRCARLVERESGAGFYVYNNHLDHRSGPSREWSVATLIDRIRTRKLPDPVVLTGDFNAGELDPAIRFLLGKAPLGADGAANPIPFVDAFRSVHPDDAMVGTYHRFLGVRFGPRVDYVFVRPGTRVLGARIVDGETGDGYVSDHFPVTATLALSPAPRSAGPVRSGGSGAAR